MKRGGGARYVLRTRYINAIYPLDAIYFPAENINVPAARFVIIPPPRWGTPLESKGAK